MSEMRTSDILRSLAATEEPVSLRRIGEAMGSRSHGLALTLLALPEALPLPIPSASIVLGIPLVFVSAHLALFGEGSRLPARLQAVVVPARVLRLLARYSVPLIVALERISRPRWFPLIQK